MWTWLLACSSAPIRLAEGEADRVEELEQVPPGTTGESVTGDPAEAFFTLGVVHSIEIEIPDEGITSLWADPDTFVEADARIDGETFGSVGVRLRGKYGAFRTLDGKPKLKIDFNRYVPEQRFLELSSLNLNNAVVDCSYLKEVMGYRVFGMAGVPALRSTFASVTLNAEPYGLYVVLDSVNGHFTDQWFDDGDGNLYDGKYWYDRTTGEYSLVDFRPRLDDLFQLESGTDVGLADVFAVTDALSAATEADDWMGAMGGVVDWESALRFAAAEHWIGHLDGYTLNRNNYYVYFDPEDGRFDFIPFDLDYAFLPASSWGMDWSNPSGVLMDRCWGDETCAEALLAANAEVIARIDTDGLLADFELAAETIAEAAAEDPRRECGRGAVGTWQDELRGWVEGASQDAEGWSP